jgi:hypothetical protein
MRPRPASELFVWSSLCSHRGKTVIVLPAPHGEYKSGISYSDALATGEIYAYLRGLQHLDVRTPDLLGDDLSENLIVIGGRKANPVGKDVQARLDGALSFDLDDGIIRDKEKQIVLTPQYAKGKERTIGNVIVDYGLLVFTGNPYGKSTHLLYLAGIKGFGTLAAAIAAVDPQPVRQIETLLKRLETEPSARCHDSGTLEVLVKVSVTNGRVRRESVQVEKIRARNGSTARTWESKTYTQLEKVVQQRLYIAVGGTPLKPLSIRARIDNREINLGKSTDRHNAIYCLAKQFREDYLKQSDNNGWVNGIVLAQRLWQIKHTAGAIEIPDEIKRQISETIKRWVTHLERRGELSLSKNIKLDSHYINSEILVFDSDIKKKIVDLVHMINDEGKHECGPGVQLIECKPGLGYRINFHPALIFITECPDSFTNIS